MSKETQQQVNQQQQPSAEVIEILKQTAELNKILLEDKVREKQERDQRAAEERKETLAKVEASIKAAKEQGDIAKQRREGCSHSMVNPANGNKRSAWRAQVNSDGYFIPMCCRCLTVMPKIKASPEQHKEGVNLGNYQELPVKALEKWHSASFPNGCDVETCYICHAPQAAEIGATA